MKQLFGQLAALFARERRLNGLGDAVRCLFNALPAVAYHREHTELLGLGAVKTYLARSSVNDALCHLSHRHYLSKRLDRRQRVNCALTHYRYESEGYDPCYLQAVYGDGGVTLWFREVDGTRYRIMLRENGEDRHEGAVSLMLFADDRQLSEMSFTWVQQSLFALDGEAVAFVTRNQLLISPRAEPLRRFRAAFPHNSPSYLALAAMQGVALANESAFIATIRHDCQIAFTEKYAEGFRRSYCEFWKSFGAIELDGQAYAMPVPLAPPPLARVSTKHRRRALNRRNIWFEVMESASKTLKQHRRIGHDHSLAIHDRKASDPVSFVSSAQPLPEVAGLP